MINRLIEPSSGNIFVDNQNILEQDPVGLRRSIGYVFQGIGLFPHMSIAENITAVPNLLGWDQNKQKKRCHELLDLMQLERSFAERMPSELSGGQRQRVGVARALAADPDYLLMDEPFGALDAVTRDELQKQILEIKNTLNKTIIFVTHDIFEALSLADRIAVLHQGRLEQIGSKSEIINQAKTDFVRDLFAKPAEQLKAYKEFN